MITIIKYVEDVTRTFMIMSDTTFYNGCGHLIANRCILRGTKVTVERNKEVCKHCHEEYEQKQKEIQSVFDEVSNENNSTD